MATELSKQGIDERRQRGTLGQDNQQAKEKQEENDRSEPPLLAQSHERPQLTEYLCSRSYVFQNAHVRSSSLVVHSMRFALFCHLFVLRRSSIICSKVTKTDCSCNQQTMHGDFTN